MTHVTKQVEHNGGLSRNQIVWLAFAASMTMFGSIFVLTGSPAGLTPAMVVGPASPDRLAGDLIIEGERGNWINIVIHDSGLHFDDHVDIDHRHRAEGLRGSGYHFVIGNGSGQLADGSRVATLRWRDQRPGAHIAIGPGQVPAEIDALNRESIGIVLVGDGDHRAPTRLQMQSLRRLIVELQQDFKIDDAGVLLHSDVSEVSSPGRFFPSHELEKYLVREG